MRFRQDIIDFFSHDISDEQLSLFMRYYKFLIEYNQFVNLTSITEEDEVFYKHFFDSLTSMKFVNFNQIETLCDMGSGAGFPSIPLKIMYPHLEITIIDSLNKRLIFLQKLLEKLEIKGVNLIHDRIETYALKHQNQFDIVTARALGDLSLISEMGLPMTKIYGLFIAYKGQQIELELNRSIDAIQKLGGELKSVNSFDLPHEYGSRSLVIITRKKSIKGYPRSYQSMKNKPL